MREVLLINPNSNRQTSAAMAHSLCAAAKELDATLSVRTATARRGPRMILDEQALSASAAEVVPLGIHRRLGAWAVVVGAFGDPGVASLRAALPIPVLGIGEAAITEAARGERRFGIATTTPRLAQSIDARVRLLGHEDRYSGLRVTNGDPAALAGERLFSELKRACELCIEKDGADAVVIGGGPLGEAADQLREAFDVPIINAVSAAGRQLAEWLRQRPV